MCGGTGVRTVPSVVLVWLRASGWFSADCRGLNAAKLPAELSEFLWMYGVSFFKFIFKQRPKLILKMWLWCVSVCLANAVCTSGRWGMCGLWISFNSSSQWRSDKNQHTWRPLEHQGAFYCCFKTSTVVLLIKFLFLKIFYCKFIYLFLQNSYSCKTSNLWNHIAHTQLLVLIFLRRTEVSSNISP